jgi:hypothetical protein
VGHRVEVRAQVCDPVGIERTQLGEHRRDL